MADQRPLVGELLPENSEQQQTTPQGWSQIALLAPLWGGLLLDVADFFSLGPQGIVIGLLAGVPLGWWIASLLGASQKWRLAAALGAAVYCFLPLTEFLPLASIASAVAALARFRGGSLTPPGTRRG